ncbi:MAG TPA: M14 family metallopeptidase [Daejeonella sp.]|nr:M14 family metallopeptidase [Daejeonella sp.]
MKNLLLFLLLMHSVNHLASAQLTPFEKSKDGNITAKYSEVVSFYEALDSKYSQVKMLTCGLTDIGKPLHLIVLSRDEVFDPAIIRKQNKRVLLINNGIHPGEPEGIDASMMLARNLLEKDALPRDVVICIIPVYNIDGSLNRGTSRINQNGPESYGFRGNYQNLDLNRDFIKGDSRNSQSFQEIFNVWKPEVFVDNHTSNGADYQYIITLIPTQKDKLHPVLAKYLSNTMLPNLYTGMEAAGYPLTPYVNSVSETPDSGIVGFLETARYSTGYAALHNTIGFMPETHMLKPYKQRVASTYEFMQQVINVVQKDAKVIGENKIKADELAKKQTRFPLSWQLDRRKVDLFNFKGYEAKYKLSEVSGLNRLYYDRNAPFEKDIQVWDKYVAKVEVEKPVAYVIPQAWHKVISLLQLNGVELQQLHKDTTLEVEMYHIADYKTVQRPYEGHYIHSNVKVLPRLQQVDFYSGDYVVYVNQPQNRYIIETLEPEGVDSFFAWNFFDSVLGQKEHFSAYVFEDEAAALLRNDSKLASLFQEEKIRARNYSKLLQQHWIGFTGILIITRKPTYAILLRV